MMSRNDLNKMRWLISDSLRFIFAILAAVCDNFACNIRTFTKSQLQSIAQRVLACMRQVDYSIVIHFDSFDYKLIVVELKGFMLPILQHETFSLLWFYSYSMQCMNP